MQRPSRANRRSPERWLAASGSLAGRAAARPAPTGGATCRRPYSRSAAPSRGSTALPLGRFLGEGAAVVGPDGRTRDERREARIRSGAGELPPALHRHAGAEEQDLDLDDERRLAPDDRLSGPDVLQVGDLEVERQRRRDDPEHGELAVQANVAGQLDRALVRDGLEPVEVDAGLDLDAARRNAEVDRHGRPELERGLDLLDAGGPDPEREEPAAAEQRHGQAERVLPLREVEPDGRRLRVERQRETGAEGRVRQCED